MPLIRFVRGTVFRGEPVGPGHEVEATEKEAQFMCEGYKDAVRVDPSTELKLGGMTVRDQIQTQEPAVSHRDPEVRPAKRNR